MDKPVFDIAYLRKYVNGELSSREMHEIERATHGDEMLMDIIMGLEIQKDQGSTYTPQDDIHQIMQRSKQKSIKKSIWYNGYAKLAATIVLFSAVALFIWQQQDKSLKTEVNIVDHEQTAPSDETQTAPLHTPTVDNSSNQTLAEVKPHPLSDPSQRVQGTEHTHSHQSRVLTPQEKQILAYTPAEKNIKINQDISGTLNLNHPKHENDVIIINTEAADKSDLLAANARKQLQSSVPDARISANPNTIPSTAQMRARLNSMGLDPQTSLILGQVIDQQSRQPLAGAAVKDLQNDNVIVTDTEGRFAYATNSKKNLEINAIGYNAKEVVAESGAQTIVLLPKDNLEEEVSANNEVNPNKSTPLMGWEKYMAHLRKELNKFTDQNYEFNVQIKLDENGKPTHVAILKSSHKVLNPKLKALIAQGPSWKKGTDWKNIQLRIKSL